MTFGNANIYENFFSLLDSLFGYNENKQYITFDSLLLCLDIMRTRNINVLIIFSHSALTLNSTTIVRALCS